MSARTTSVVRQRTQVERSAATRQLLVDTTVHLMQLKGWGATNAVSVCEMAGVTRGALFHHYQNFSELIADALNNVCDALNLGVSEVSAVSHEQLLDRTWAIFSDKRFKVVLEAWWVAGNSKDVQSEIRKVMKRVAQAVAPQTKKSGALNKQDDHVFIVTSRECLLGLAFGRATNGGKALPHEQLVLDDLRKQARELDNRATSR